MGRRLQGVSKVVVKAVTGSQKRIGGPLGADRNGTDCHPNGRGRGFTHSQPTLDERAVNQTASQPIPSQSLPWDQSRHGCNPAVQLHLSGTQQYLSRWPIARGPSKFLSKANAENSRTTTTTTTTTSSSSTSTMTTTTTSAISSCLCTGLGYHPRDEPLHPTALHSR